MRGHAAVYRATGGRVGGKLPGVPSLLLLDHVGAKSGKRRTTPLVYMPDGENLLIVASKGGHPRDPGWMHNLRANPETEVQIGRKRISVRGRRRGARAPVAGRGRLQPALGALPHAHLARDPVRPARAPLELVRILRQRLAAVLGDQQQVLEAHAANALQALDARLDGDD